MPTTIRATKPAILIASLLLTTGFAVAGPAAAMADDTVQTRGAALPTSIVNGDFEYLGDRILSQAIDTYNFANVDYVHGQASTFSPDDTYIIKAYPLEYALNGGSGTTPNQQEGR